jgi:hypothetical protein
MKRYLVIKTYQFYKKVFFFSLNLVQVIIFLFHSKFDIRRRKIRGAAIQTMRRWMRKPVVALVCGVAGAVTAAWYMGDISAAEVPPPSPETVKRDQPNLVNSILLQPFHSSRKQEEKLVQVKCEHLPDILEPGHTLATDTRAEHEKYR